MRNGHAFVMLGLIAGFVILSASNNPKAMNASSQEVSSARDNPWSTMFDDVPPIRVRDPKAAAVGAVEQGREPVFEITLTDVGTYFGYIFSPVIVGYFMTDLALQQLYPNALPVRGQIRVASQSESDFMLVASYITGARPFYFFGGMEPSDLVVDPSLGYDGGYALIFQRKDTGRTVRVHFNRKALIPNDEEYHFAARASFSLLNGQPLDDPEAARRTLAALMEKSMSTFGGVYEVDAIERYTFPEGN